MDTNRLIRKHYTSTEAVKLFEDNNKVFKLLKNGYSSSEASSSKSEGIFDMIQMNYFHLMKIL